MQREAISKCMKQKKKVGGVGEVKGRLGDNARPSIGRTLNIVKRRKVASWIQKKGPIVHAGLCLFGEFQWCWVGVHKAVKSNPVDFPVDG